MIQALSLRNFQGHRKLKVQLAPGITTITGATDSGKSSLVRALYLVAMNQPSGANFATHGTDDTAVAVLVDDQVVHRKRSKASNSYWIGAKEFKAFGQKVPDEVAELLKMGDLNFQHQMEGPFWFAHEKSGGEIARELNLVVDLGVVDDALQNVASKLRHARTVVDVSEGRLAQAVETCKETVFAVEMNEDLTIVEAAQAAHKRERKKLVALVDLMTTAEDTKATRDSARDTIKGIDFATLDALRDAMQEVQRRRTALLSLELTVRTTKTAASDRRAQADAAVAELRKKTGGRCPICGGPLK